MKVSFIQTLEECHFDTHQEMFMLSKYQPKRGGDLG